MGNIPVAAVSENFVDAKVDVRYKIIIRKLDIILQNVMSYVKEFKKDKLEGGILMSIKNNAKTAWKELGKMVEPTAANTEKQVTPAPKTEKEPEKEMKKTANVKEELKATSNAQTMISAGTTIRGDLTVAGDLVVSGTVHGNIECAGLMKCEGTVNGDIVADNIVFEAAKVKGNLQAKNSVSVDDASIVTGNVSAKSIALDGKLKGDLNISEVTQLNSHAVLVGNITTKSLYIHEESRFSGAVKMSESKDLNAMFPKDNE